MMASRALLKLALAGLFTLPSTCNVYRSDVGKLCDAEQLSQGSLRSNKPALFTWMERNVASSDGIVFVRLLEGKDTAGIAVQLRDEARKLGLPSCALAEQADLFAKDQDFNADIQNLCAGSAASRDGSLARLDILGADDAERMREVSAWSATNTKTPEAAAIVAKLGTLGPRQRGAYLRAEAAKLGVDACSLASTLDMPADPPPPSLASQATPVGPSPNFTVLKVDAPASFAVPIAEALTARDAAAPIQACYAAALAATPAYTAALTFKMSIGGSGKVVSASPEVTSKRGTLPACIATELGSLVVATPPGPRDGAASVKPFHATVTLQLTPSSSGPGYTATIDPAWLAKAQPKRR